MNGMLPMDFPPVEIHERISQPDSPGPRLKDPGCTQMGAHAFRQTSRGGVFDVDHIICSMIEQTFFYDRIRRIGENDHDTMRISSMKRRTEPRYLLFGGRVESDQSQAIDPLACHLMGLRRRESPVKVQTVGTQVRPDAKQPRGLSIHAQYW